MSEVPEQFLYTKDHEWIAIAEDGTATVGITDYAQESLGDITFVEFPDVDTAFSEGETFGVVESVKAASDLFMPVAGTVIEINDAVDTEPELLNQSPYTQGWLLKLRLDPSVDKSQLLSAQDYQKIL